MTKLATTLAVLLLAACALAPSAHAAGQFGGPTVAIMNAIDDHAAETATAQGWEYVDRTDMRGDYRHATAILTFLSPSEVTLCDRGGRHCKTHTGSWEWDVEVRADRCSPGVYAVQTTIDGDPCPGQEIDPAAWWRGWPVPANR